MDKENGTIQGKYIFLAISVCLLILTTVSVYLADRDNKNHEGYYTLYNEANSLFEDEQYAEAEKYYRELTQVYPTSYILELKQSVCAVQTDDCAGALFHAKQALMLHPLLAEDPEFMNILIYCYEYFEDDANLKIIEEYQREF